MRDHGLAYRREFIPVRLEEREDLRKEKATAPWIWSWKDGHIASDLNAQ